MVWIRHATAGTRIKSFARFCGVATCDNRDSKVVAVQSDFELFNLYLYVLAHLFIIMK